MLVPSLSKPLLVLPAARLPIEETVLIAVWRSL